MPEKIVTRGIVLRATETKEADYILTVLTAELGKLSVVARGARRRTSRVAASCQFPAFSELVLYQRGNWYYLSEANTITLFGGVCADLEKLSLSAYFAETVEAVTAEGENTPEILSLLLNSLYALDTLEKPLWQVKAAFELRLLSLSGYEPLIADCAVCGDKHPPEPMFDAGEGVLLCKKCAPGGGLCRLDAGSLAAMRHVVGSESKKMLSFMLNGESRKSFSAVCETFAAVQLDRRFRTLDFYKSLQIDNKA